MELKPFAGAEKPEPCLILCIDLQNSTEFFKSPDADVSVQRYLNKLIADLNALIKAKPTSIDENGADFSRAKAMPRLAHSKFLGDGFLLIWHMSQLRSSTVRDFLERLMHFQRRFPDFNKKLLQAEINTLQVPNAIRFGLTAGSLRRLIVDRRKPYLDEWIGPGINRAARLQGYCKELGFLAHDVHLLDHADLAALDLVKVVAVKMKSHEEKILVHVDSMAFSTLSESSSGLFERVEHM
mgnify:CR=1 FL=1